jgi:hypothetical protein
MIQLSREKLFVDWLKAEGPAPRGVLVSVSSAVDEMQEVLLY